MRSRGIGLLSVAIAAAAGTALESWVRDGYRLLNKPFRLSEVVEAVDEALKRGAKAPVPL